MDVLLIGVLCAGSFVLGSLLWHLHVHPDVVVGALAQRAPTEGFDEDQVEATLLTWLRRALAVLVVLSGFVTGAVIAFLAATG